MRRFAPMWFVPTCMENTAQVSCGTDFYEPSVDLLEESGLRIHHGISTDGVELCPNTGVFLATADCPTVVLVAGDQVLVLHCARRSIVDEGRVWGRDSVRRHESVIDAALERIEDCSQVQAWIVCGTGPFPHTLDHDVWGDYNKLLLPYVTEKWGPQCVTGEDLLSLHWIIRGQLAVYGVSEEDIREDGIDTRTNSDWWSCGRGEAQRNGVFVSCNQDSDCF